MSRRQRTVLTLSVKIPVPTGWTQQKLLKELTQTIKNDEAFSCYSAEIQTKIEKRETTYL